MAEAGPLPVGRFSQAEGHSSSFGGLCLLHRAEHPVSVRCTHAGTLCALERSTLRAVLVGESERRDDAACRALRRALAPLIEPAESGSRPEGPEGVITSQRSGARSGLAPFSPAGYPPSFSPALSREVAATVDPNPLS